MRKRVLSVALVLSMLLGLLPTAALAASDPVWSSRDDFGITLADASECYYYHGDDIESFQPTVNGRGAYGDSAKASPSYRGVRINFQEQARYKTADILLQPFTIDVKVPAHTCFSVKYSLSCSISRNSSGSTGYYMEVFQAPTQEDFDFSSLLYSAKANDNGSNNYTDGRTCFNNWNGGMGERSLLLTFGNDEDEEKVISYPMACLVGCRSSGSSQSGYFHQIAAALSIIEHIRVPATWVAEVNGRKYCSVSDAAAAYNSVTDGSAEFKLLSDAPNEDRPNATADLTLTQPGTVDLNGYALAGTLTVNEPAGATVTINGGGGSLVSAKSYDTTLHHTGQGELKLENLTVKAAATSGACAVKNSSGKLTVDHTVTIDPTLNIVSSEAVTFTNGGPAITQTQGRQAVPHIYIGDTPITLGSAFSKPSSPYKIKIGPTATEGKPVDIAVGWPSSEEDPNAYFTDIDNERYHFFVEEDGNNGLKVVARPSAVTFDAGEGASVTPERAFVSASGKLSALPSPTRPGYIFKGWMRGNEKVTRNTVFPTDTTVTAEWDVPTVKVSFNLNGGTGTAPEQQTFSVGTKYALPADPTRENYSFAGWFTAASGGTQVTADTEVTQLSDHTLYARWTRQTVSVTFNYNYDSASDPFTYKLSKGNSLGCLPSAYRDGYIMTGWYTAADENGEKVFSSTVPEGGETYYAHWEKKPPKKYTVTYSANGGKIGNETSSTQLVIAGDTYSLPTNLTRENYDLVGWFTRPSGGTEVENGAVVTAEDHTLYAQWTAKTGTVTFNAGTNGSVSPETMTVTYGRTYGEGTGLTKKQLPVPTNTQENQKFVGWFTAADGGTQVTASTAVTSIADQTLYAHWVTVTTHTHKTHEDGAKEEEFKALRQEDFDNAKKNTTLSTNTPAYNGVKFISQFSLVPGNYYLDGDIDLDYEDRTYQIEIDNDGVVNLCLNGHTIRSSINGFVLDTTARGCTLNICDCQGGGGVTNNNIKDGSCLQVYQGSANLYGGTFTSGSSSEYCVRAYSRDTGELTIDGATLVGATEPGGNNKNYALLADDGKATIKSGTLTGYDGGVKVNFSNATLTVEGGSITGSGDEGFGIYNNSGNVTVTGGTITGSAGIKIYGYGHLFEGDLILGGSPTIQGRTASSSSIILDNSKTISRITVQEGLQGVFSVDYVPQPGPGTAVNITVEGDKDEAEHFIPSDPEHYVIRDVVSGGKHVVKMYSTDDPDIPDVSGTPSGSHEHFVCGATGECPHAGEHTERLTWTDLPSGTTSLAAGNYGLSEDLTADLTIPAGTTVNLCLTGHTITGTVTVNGTLNLCDCKGGGKITGETAAVVIEDGGVLNQFGGTVSAAEEPVDLKPGGTWNFYGGTLEATGEDTKPKIVPEGTLNLLGEDDAINMGGGYIEFTGTDQSINVSGKPKTPYDVKESEGGKVAANLPVNGNPADYLNYIGDAGSALGVQDGQVVVRNSYVIVDDGRVLETDKDGKLSESVVTELNNVTSSGYKFEGYYTEPNGGGDKVDLGGTFDGDTKIYAKWTLCDHPGNTPTTIAAATCTEAGVEKFTCSVCGLTVEQEISALGHDVEDAEWVKDEDEGVHYQTCSTCNQRVNEAPHEWGKGTRYGDGQITYRCNQCKATKDVFCPGYTVTYELDDYTTGQKPAPMTAYEGEVVVLPEVGELSRIGYNFAGWVLLDAESNGDVHAGGTTYAPTRNVIFQIHWTRVDPYNLKNGETIVLEDGTSIKLDGNTVTVTQPGIKDENGDEEVPGQKTVITLPSIQSVEVTGNKIIVVAGATVVTTPGGGEPGPTVTIGEGGGSVDTSGGVEASTGTTVTTDDGTTVTITDGDGVITSDGNVSFPPTDGKPDGGGKVSVTDGTGTPTEVEVDGKSEGLNPETGEAPPYVERNDQVQIGNITITLPNGGSNPSTGGVKDDGNGNIIVPGGSKVEKPDGTSETVGKDSVVTPEGDITDPSDPSPSGTATLKPGENTTVDGATIMNNDDGTVTIVKDGTTTIVKMPTSGDVTVDKTTGEVTVPDGSVVTTGSGPEITLPGGGTAAPGGKVTGNPIVAGNTTVTVTDPAGVTPTAGENGNVTVPPGSTATVVDTEGNTPDVTVTVPKGGTGGTVKPDGDIVLPPGSSVTVTGSSGTPVTTVTMPGNQGGTVTPNSDGTVTVPGGSTVQTGTNTPVIVGENGGILDPETGKVTESGDTPGGETVLKPNESQDIPGGGSVVNNGGGSVTVTDKDGTKTDVTLPEGTEDVTVDESTGKVTLPGDSTVTTGDSTVIVGPGGGSVNPGGGVDVPAGGSVTVPGGDGQDNTTVTMPDDKGGTIKPNPDGGVDVPGGSTVTTGGSTVIVGPGGGTVNPDGSVDVPEGSTVQTGGGAEITVGPGSGGTVTPGGDVVVPGGGKVTIPGGSGQDDTTVTVPGGQGGTVSPNPDGSVDVPEGSTVQTGSGTEITVGPGSGGTVTPGGSVVVPGGGSVTIPDGEGGRTEITVPGGENPGTVKPGNNGGVEAPGGSTVTHTDKDGTETGTETVPAGGGTVNPDGTVTGGGNTPGSDTELKPNDSLNIPGGGTVTNNGDGTVTITDGKGGETIVTLPAGTENVTVDKDTGEVTLPGGSEVKTGDGPSITTGGPGTAAPGGTVTGSPVTVGGTTVTVTQPAGGSVSVDKDGNVTVPGGTTVTADKDGDGTPETTITIPGGDRNGTIRPDGGIELPAGGSVQTGGGPAVTLPEGGKADGQGTVTGSPVTVGGTTVTVTQPADGSVSVDKDGNVTVPGGTTVTVDKDGDGTPETTVTIPGGGGNGTIKPDGGIELPAGGSVSVPDGAAVTLPTGGSVETDENGQLVVPGETVVTRPDGSDETVPAGGGAVDPVTGEITPNISSSFTVTFDAQGGTPVPEAQTVSKGGLVSRPVADPAREGFDFDGWFREASCSNVWDFDKDTVTGNVTLYAKWIKTFAVSGSVVEKDEDGQPSAIKYATVKLVQGNKQFDEQTTEDGTYSFSGVRPGSYNVVATTPDGRTMTILVTVVDADLMNQTLNMPRAKVNSVLEVVGTQVVVGNLEAEAEEGVEAGSTATVTLTMTVESKEETASDISNDVNAIKGEAGAKKKLDLLAITVVKEVESEGTTTTEDIRQTTNLLQIILPFDFTNKTAIVVYRCHGDGGRVETLTISPNADQEYIKLDENSGIITIFAKKFSTYAVGYEETGPIVGPPGGDPSEDPDITHPTDEYPTGGYPAGGSPAGGTGSYTPVIVQPDHGTVSVSPTSARKGQTVTVTVTPDSGYEIDSVTVTDKDGSPVAVTRNPDGTYSFVQPKGSVNVSAALKRSGTPVSSCPLDASCPVFAFPDCTVSAWYHDGVHFCVENGLMSGYDTGLFGPGDTLSRAMLAQILYNQAGRPAGFTFPPFEDVPADAWYADAVAWCAQTGVVTGYGGRFLPEDPITREQLAAMLYRSAGSPVPVGNLSAFPDAAATSDWAVAAMRWAVELGILNGKDGLLDPTGKATRAEAATMLMRYVLKTRRKKNREAE